MRKLFVLPIVATLMKVALLLAVFAALRLTANAQCASASTTRVVTYQQPQVMTYIQKIPITTTYLPAPVTVTYQPPPVTQTTYQYQTVQASACATVAASACSSGSKGHGGLFSTLHQRRADKLESKAAFHQARADHLAARRGGGVSVMVGEGAPMMMQPQMQPQAPQPYPPVEAVPTPPKKLP